MYRVLTAKPHYESKLVLPKLVFPNKYAAYTVRSRLSIRNSLIFILQRYRNPTRTVQSAYWDRVEDRFDQEKQCYLIIQNK